MGKVLVVGGAGFIGSHVVASHLERGDEVLVYDVLQRKGVDSVLSWLEEKGNFSVIQADVREYATLRKTLDSHRDLDTVYHLAAQVAVTTSVTNPRLDFEVNALGTLNVLEAIRETGSRAVVLYASSNKVYGKTAGAAIEETRRRYQYRDLKNGISETQPLDLRSPYGCSKGAADQYVCDYYRTYGIRTITFRQSCIYGRWQFGLEDQGWVAWFIIAALLGRPITLYGNGKQVRDILYIDDLIECYHAARERISVTSGEAYNVGGGARNTLSLLELLDFLEERLGRRIPRKFADWRPGDQRVFIADVSRAKSDFDWEPQVSALQGVDRSLNWAQNHSTLLRELF